MKALIPAAGLGTRWYPWTHVVPKELLPVGRHPAIHLVLDEAVAAGIDDIGIIIRYGKDLIRIYVEQIWQSSQAGEVKLDMAVSGPSIRGGRRTVIGKGLDGWRTSCGPLSG